MTTLRDRPLSDLERRTWDAVIVGAGAAGGVAAATLARAGADVLLVDKSEFPRDKVCGCYVNPAAVAVLDAAGLGDLPRQCGARPVGRMEWHVGRATARFSLRGGLAVSRGALDAALAAEAVRCGATFLPRTAASLAGLDVHVRRVALRRGDECITASAAVVIVADGVSGRVLESEPKLTSQIAPAPRIGIGAMLDECSPDYQTNTIYMASGRYGYLGLLRVEGARLPVAAAVDPAWLRSIGGPAQAAAALLAGAGLPPIAALEHAAWKGTAALTRRRNTHAAERLFVIGDAAGYVEPFTGEGIGWALAGGVAVADFARAAATRWNPALIDGWNEWYAATIRPRQWNCGVVAALLRRPWLAGLSARLMSIVPGLHRAVTAMLHAPLRSRGANTPPFANEVHA